MGILDIVLSPLKDIIKGLTEPVEAIKKIFGVVISTIEGIINLIEGLVSDIENLFNAQSIEETFLRPFKTATLVAVDSVEKIFELIKGDLPSFKGFKRVIITPFEDAYSMVSDFMKSLHGEIESIITTMENYAGTLETEIFSRIKILVVSVESIPSELFEIGKKIKGSVEIESKKLIRVIPEIEMYAEKTITPLTKSIEHEVQMDIESFESVKKSIEARFTSENFVADIVGLIVVLVFLALLALFTYLTKDFLVAGVFILMSVVLFSAHYVLEYFR